MSEGSRHRESHLHPVIVNLVRNALEALNYVRDFCGTLSCALLPYAARRRSPSSPFPNLRECADRVLPWLPLHSGLQGA
jgi:hypothetical protein